MKRILLLLQVFLILLCFVGCDDVYERTTYTDVKDYKKIWGLSERRSGGKYQCDIFPKDVSNLNVKELYCDHTVYLPLGTGFEVLLSIEYDEQLFTQEINRISNLSKENSVVYDTYNFVFPAYVAMLGYHNCNEYALVDEKNLTIHYIYLQLVHKEDLEINTEYLPPDFDFGDVEGYNFSIYHSLFDGVDSQFGYINTYSREYVNGYSEDNASFYTGRDNAIYVALEYLYNDEKVKNICGDKFEIHLEDVVTVKDNAETKNYFFDYYFRGEAEYIISIDEVSYRIILEKDWKGKWKVIECDLAKDN